MKTVAFYSYKGGVGRSLFVSNLSLFLAHFAEKKVVTVDFDLEAPGLHYKYAAIDASVQEKVLDIKAGLVDTLHDYLYAPSPPATLPILELLKTSTGGSVHFYPAGSAPSTEYWEKLGQIDFHSLLREKRQLGSALFQEVLEHIREQLEPDIVMIDARTGVTDIGGAAAQLWAQTAFCIALDEAEHLEGLRAVMRSIARQERLDGQGLIQTIAVLSRLHTVYGSDEENTVRERVRQFLNEKGPTPEETLSIASVEDLVVLHNDEEAYRTGRVPLGDVLRGRTKSVRRLIADYYDAGMGLLDAADKSKVLERLLAGS